MTTDVRSGPGDDRPGSAWFSDARFGMFVHWGAYAARGWEPSWPLVGSSSAFPHGQDLGVAEYDRCFAEFAPPPDAPRAWAALARRCGMRYVVLTTKHHDGYTLFPTEHSPIGVHRTLPGRDLVREFVDAVRDEGLRVGFYFSLSDWHHPDYPPFADEMRPYQFLGYPRPDADTWARFVSAQRAQLTQLLSDYGTVDVLWFDGGWERFPDEWGAGELAELIYGLQPDIVVNDRCPGLPGYQTPEQVFPAQAPPAPWETCLTMNRSWGNVAADTEHKSAPDLVAILTEVAARGGNLLLNASPDGDGAIPDWQVDRFEAIASWLDANGAAVLAAGPGLESWQFHGPSTAAVDADGTHVVYLHCPYRPTGSLVVRGVHPERVEGVRLLGADATLTWRPRLSALDEILGGDPVGDLAIEVPAAAVDALGPLADIGLVVEVRSAQPLSD